MNRHLLIGAALLSLMAAGCSNEDIIENPAQEVITGKAITLNATINNGADTRLIYTDDETAGKMTVAWSSEESFTMYRGTNGTGSEFKNTSAATGTFTGNDIEGTDTYYAVYGDGIVNNNGILSIDIANQTGTSAEKGIKEFMLATAETLGDDTKLTFEHKLAVLKLSLALPESTSETKATKITITGLHKKATYDLSKDAYAYQATDNGAITATNGETGYAIEGGKITAYIAVFPEKIEANSLIITTEIGSQSYAYTVKSSAQLPAGKVTPVTANLAKVLYCISGTLTAEAVKAVISNNNLVIASDKDLTSADFAVLRSVLGSDGGYGNGTINLTLLNQISLPVDGATGALESCTSLKSVSAPNVTDINNCALFSCTFLTSVSLPKATSVGQTAFSGCDILTSVSLPKVTSVKEGAFYGCSSLNSVSLPEATSLGDFIFEGCDNIDTLFLPKATTVGADAFYDCNRSKIALTTSDASNWYKELGGNEGDNYGWKSLTIIKTNLKVNLKSAYTKEDYFYWDAYTYYSNGSNTFSEGNYGYHTGGEENVTAEHSCASCPTADQMKMYLGAGVYWDNGAEGQNQQTYTVNGSECHAGLWVMKKAYIDGFSEGTAKKVGSTPEDSSILHTGRPDKSEIGKYFFLPAAGGYYEGDFMSPDTYGLYWSSSPKYNEDAYGLLFADGFINMTFDSRTMACLPMVSE